MLFFFFVLTGVRQYLKYIYHIGFVIFFSRYFSWWSSIRIFVLLIFCVYYFYHLSPVGIENICSYIFGYTIRQPFFFFFFWCPEIGRQPIFIPAVYSLPFFLSLFSLPDFLFVFSFYIISWVNSSLVILCAFSLPLSAGGSVQRLYKNIVSSLSNLWGEGVYFYVRSR